MNLNIAILMIEHVIEFLKKSTRKLSKSALHPYSKSQEAREITGSK